MFRKSLLQLTTVYLAIVMAISLFFSVVLYQLSASELTRDYDRQVNLFRQRLPGLDSVDQYLAVRAGDLNDEKLRLIGQLAIVNIVILGIGGLTSYFLASRTLEPIEKSLDAQR